MTSRLVFLLKRLEGHPKVIHALCSQLVDPELKSMLEQPGFLVEFATFMQKERKNEQAINWLVQWLTLLWHESLDFLTYPDPILVFPAGTKLYKKKNTSSFYLTEEAAGDGECWEIQLFGLQVIPISPLWTVEDLWQKLSWNRMLADVDTHFIEWNPSHIDSLLELLESSDPISEGLLFLPTQEIRLVTHCKLLSRVPPLSS